MLYVEENNAAAVRRDESRGFRRFPVDVSWRQGAVDR
jgi:mycothiol synthase